MGRFIFKPALSGLALLLLALSLFADITLLDNHSDASNKNEFKGYWYYYDDNSGVKEDDRPLAGPETTPSVIDVDFDLVPREAFGDKSDTYQVKEYTFVVGEHADEKYASMPFTFGEMWKASWCDEEACSSPYVGVGCTLQKEGKPLNLIDATGIKFRVRSKTNPLTVIFKAEQQDVSDDSTLAYYQFAVAVATTWSEKTILFEDMTQPIWATVAQKTDFGITQLNKLVWEVVGKDNTGIKTDELMIDDIYIVDNSGVGINHSIPKPLGNKGFATSYRNNTVMVNWNTRSAISGKISIVNTRGIVVATIPVTRTSALNANISTARIPSGLYFVQFNGRDVRSNAVLQQSVVSIVK